MERAQLLIESPSRTALQLFLADRHAVLQAVRLGPEGKVLIRRAVSVDLLTI